MNKIHKVFFLTFMAGMTFGAVACMGITAIMTGSGYIWIATIVELLLFGFWIWLARYVWRETE